jgi:hypothetical protein
MNRNRKTKKLETKEQAIGNIMNVLHFRELLNCIAVRKQQVLDLAPYPAVQLEHLDVQQLTDVMTAIRYNFKTERIHRFSDAEFHGVIRDMCEDVQTNLDLHQCHGGELYRFDDVQLGIVMQALKRNQRLHSTGDLFNHITEAPTEQQSILLGHTLQQLPHLQDIDTTGLIISSKRKRNMISSILGGCTSLQSLVIGRVGPYAYAIHDIGAFEISHYIATNTSLTSLTLNYNNIQSPGINSIRHALMSNSTLTTLNLDNNVFGDGDLIHLLNASTHLRTLGLSTTHVKLVDHEHILPMMSHLTSLDLTRLHLHYEVLEAILTKGHLEQLTALNLNAAGLQPMHMPLLQQYMKNNTCLTNLDVSFNVSIVGHAATSLAGLLRQNSTLKSLSLDHINMGVSGMRAFVDAMLVNTTLIDLSFARLGPMTTPSRHTAVAALVSLIETHPTLRRLDVSGCRLDAHHLVQLGLAIKRAMRWNPISLIIRGHENSTCTNTSTLVDPAVQEQIGIMVQPSIAGSICEQEYIVDAFHHISQEMVLAFVMGSHSRIGEVAIYKELAPDIVTKIAQLFIF